MTDSIPEMVLRAIGLFYAATSIWVIRTIAISSLADSTWTAIMGERPHLAVRWREIWLAAGTLVVGAGGVALVLLLDAALPLFIVGLLQQAIYLFYVAPRWLDPYDEPDGEGRRRTANAALTYTIATSAVIVAYSRGMLRAWSEQPIWLLAGAALLVASVALWTILSLYRTGPK